MCTLQFSTNDFQTSYIKQANNLILKIYNNKIYKKYKLLKINKI